MTPPINSVSPERLDELAQWAASEEAECLQDDMPISAGYYADIIKLIAARRAANTPVDGVRALELADALDEFADIDEAEGGNPHVIATEREAAQQLRALSCLTSPAAEPVAYQQRERRVAPDGSVTVWSEWHWTPQAAYLEFCRDGGDRSKFQYEVRPLYTHPAPSASREVTVTDEMVERAARNIAKRRGEMSSWDDLPPSVREDYLFDARSALLAALPEREG